MRTKLGTFLIVLGAVLVFAALSLFLYNRWEDAAAGDAADEVLDNLLDIVEETDPVTGAPALIDPYDTEMTVREIEGYGYIGYLSIPALNLELPVMSEWDYTRLRIAPCRYAGSTKTDDLVIAGHNYTRHFGTLYTLKIGDFVFFTDMDNVKSVYTVEGIETLDPTDVLRMVGSGFDLTLYTCTVGGANRVTVRCRRVAAE